MSAGTSTGDSLKAYPVPPVTAAVMDPSAISVTRYFWYNTIMLCTCSYNVGLLLVENYYHSTGKWSV